MLRGTSRRFSGTFLSLKLPAEGARKRGLTTLQIAELLDWAGGDGARPV
jgi:hypothetical protein